MHHCAGQQLKWGKSWLPLLPCTTPHQPTAHFDNQLCITLPLQKLFEQLDPDKSVPPWLLLLPSTTHHLPSVRVYNPLCIILQPQELFEQLDSDKSGSISFEELTAGLRKQGYVLSDSEIEQLMRKARGAGMGNMEIVVWCGGECGGLCKQIAVC